MIESGTAAQRWRRELESWAIPDQLIAAAGRSPWGHQPGRFAARADAAVADPSGASFVAAAGALDEVADRLGRAGSLLDVGAGVGAASLPLLDRVASLTAVDPSAPMLAGLNERAKAIAPQVTVTTVEGRWPDSADEAKTHDVVVCHHVLFDVPEVVPFLQSLTAAARTRVVVEIPPAHPLTWLNPLFAQFHGIDRPTGPTVDVLVAVLHELGIRALTVERWNRLEVGRPTAAARVALVTQRLALPVDREPDVAAALADQPDGGLARVVTLSWAGSALG